MVDIVLSTDDVTVLGGPSSVSFEVGTGATGDRGSRIYQGDEDPNNMSDSDFDPDLLDLPKIYDLFLVISPSSSDYLQFYQYVQRDGSQVWDKILKMSQSSYAINTILDFTSGLATKNINLFELDELGLVFDNLPSTDPDHFPGGTTNTYALFNIQITLDNDSLPSAVSVSAGDIYAGPEPDYAKHLPITVNAAEWNGSTWSDIDGKSVAAHIVISIVDPVEVLDAVGGGS